jgi:hypothetical protein
MINPKELRMFCYWITERESIRLQKEAGLPKPWTMDKIMASHHFCNVRREDDRGTKERRAVVRKYENCFSINDLPWIYTASNLFNHAPTLETVLFHQGAGDPADVWISLLQMRMNAGQKVFHTAYVVSTCGAAMSKVDYCANVIIEVAKLSPANVSCRAAFNALRSVHGLGSFLASQVVADLKNDRYLADAMDWHSFSTMGPGSKKGLDLLFGGGTTERNYDARMEELTRSLPDNIKVLRLHAQDLQNCLCEFSKYDRYFHNKPGRRRDYV